MSTEKVADRLLSEARKKTKRESSPILAKAALIVGVIALLVSPISIAGWVVGVAAIGMGVPAINRPEGKRAKIAIVLGFAAILVATFFFTLNIARSH
jgi:hypothetical protein